MVLEREASIPATQDLVREPNADCDNTLALVKITHPLEGVVPLSKGLIYAEPRLAVMLGNPASTFPPAVAANCAMRPFQFGSTIVVEPSPCPNKPGLLVGSLVHKLYVSARFTKRG